MENYLNFISSRMQAEEKEEHEEWVSVKMKELEQKLILLSKCNECSHDDIC